MTRRRTITFTLLLAILFSACGGSPSASGAQASPAASGPGSHPLPSFEIPGNGLEAAAEHDEQVWADAMQASGAAEALGPALLAWVDEQRHAFVEKILADNGLQAGGEIASTDPRFGIEGQTALGGAGLTLFLTGGFLRVFTESMSADRESGDFSHRDSDTKETEIDGQKATVKSTFGVDFHFSGSRVDGTVDISITTTVFGPNGQPIGTMTFTTTATVDMEVCPDIDGGLNAHFDTENDVIVTGSIRNAGASYHLATTGVATGEVGEDAFLHGLHVTGESGQRTSGNTGIHAFDAAVRMDFRGTLATPGQLDSVGIEGGNFSEDVTRLDDNTTSDDLTKLDVEVFGTGYIVASLLFEAAQKKWRNGYCVRIEATEQSRTVEPDEVVPFTAKVFHNFDGSELDKPIVTTLNGVKSATPLDTPQDPPANITYTAGPNEGDAGTVTLKSTSNRGIGELALTFTVAPELVMRFDMESEITATMLSQLPGGGTALVYGEIYLEKDATGHWSGQGDLTSKTTPARGGCNTATVKTAATSGEDTYNWWIRDVVARPESTTIDLSMDAPPPDEQPDIVTTVFCPGPTTTGKMNTWENLFFITHFQDRGALGLHVTNWTIVATPDTWKTGGLVAEAEWTENCDGPRAAPLAGLVATCHGSTYMRLRLVPAPAP